MKSSYVCSTLLFLAALALSGCTQVVRYSPDEIKGYPPAIQDAIRQGQVMTGMTTQQVRYALGSPSTVNILSPTEDGKPREEWLYSTVNVFMKTRLLFVDGKLMDVFPEQKPAPQPPPAQPAPSQPESPQPAGK